MSEKDVFIPPNKAMTPIIKAVGNACNLRCGYCFYNGTDQKSMRIMSGELLSQFFGQYLDIFSGKLRFVWHGGEPLLAGIPFYQEALRLQHQFAKSQDVIENMVQTNATLIDDAWAEFFRAYDFKVGVSLDGDQVSHDCFRRDAGGKGTFQRTVRGIRILKRHGITPGVIQTVSKKNLGNLRSDFRFFAEELGIRGWGINFFEAGSSSYGEISNCGLTDRDVAGIYQILRELWLEKNDSGLCLREIDNVVAGVVGRRAKNCSYNGSCANYFCLDADGRIWPCDRLSNSSEFLLGDLRSQDLREVLAGAPARAHADKSRQLGSDCVLCQWRGACNNGCTAMRDIKTGTYQYCKARQEAFQAMSDLLHQSK